MQELETLLNSLIKMGWKPWGIKADFSEYKFGKFRFIKMSGEIVRMCNLRELVSLESGLWQFCMEKRFVPKGLTFWQKGKKTLGLLPEILQYDYKYRLLESALIPEDKLGQFLLDNIIVEGKKE